MVAGIDITEKYKEAKACTGKDGTVAQKSAYVQCLASAVNGIVGPLDKAFGGDSAEMHKIIGDISKISTGVSQVDSAALGAYNSYLELKGAMGNFKWPGSVSQVENSVKDLGTSMSYLAGSLSSLTGAKATRFQAVCDHLVKDVTVFQNADPTKGPIGKAGAIMVNNNKVPTEIIQNQSYTKTNTK